MKFEIFQSEANQKYYFRLKAKNGQIILASNAYETKAEAEAAIAAVQARCGDDSNFETKEGANEKWYFTLKGADGKSIGKSQGYASTSTMKNGIASVQKVAPEAPVVTV